MRTTGYATELLDHLGWIERLAARIVRDPHRAADAVQETVHHALSHPPAARENLRAWLATVLVNTIRQIHRGREATAFHEARFTRDSGPACGPGADESLEQREQWTRLLEALNELPESPRTAILLQYAGQCSLSEISIRMGLSLHTVRSQIKRGLEKLRRSRGELRHLAHGDARLPMSSTLEGLLHEIAHDSRSSLLRMDSAQLVREARSGPASFCDATTGLSTPERKLLRTYREEVGLALKELCKARLLTDPKSWWTFVPLAMPDSTHAQDPYVLLQELRSQGRASSLAPQIRRALEMAISSDEDARPNVARIAAAALRLVPHQHNRLLFGFCLMVSGAPRLAIRQYQPILTNSASPLAEFIAWRNIACALELARGDRTRALDCHLRSVKTKPGPLVLEGLIGWVSILFHAAQCGDMSLALCAAERLGDSRMTGTLNEHAQRYRHARFIGRWQSTRRSVRLIHALIHRPRTSDDVKRFLCTAWYGKPGGK